MKTFTLQKLSFGAICVDGDCNQPWRSEKMGVLDIDADMPRVCKQLGIGSGDTVVDIGGWIGDTAISFAQTGAKVHVVEPFFDAFVCLIFNTRGMDVSAINAPAGNGEMVELVYECPGPNLAMRSVKPSQSPNAIQTFRVDSLNLQSCKLIKIDCEGAEIETLLGAAETIKRCRPILFVEHYVDALAKRGHTGKDLEDCIRSFGYELEMFGEPPRWDWLCKPIGQALPETVDDPEQGD